MRAAVLREYGVPSFGDFQEPAAGPGEHVLVLGASGVLGQIAVQAAKLLGAERVVAAARSREGLERRGVAAAAGRLAPQDRAGALSL